MRLIRMAVICSPTTLQRGISLSACTHRGFVFQSKCIRQYSQMTSPIQPPQATDSTSQSSGLNHQSHPSGRPPLKFKEPITSTATEAGANPNTKPPIDGTAPHAYRTSPRMPSSSDPISTRESAKVVYEGPLRKTVRGLKAFSISSLILSTAMTPFVLTMEANLPMVARVSMITVALGASLLSTGLIHYFLSPYVVKATYMSLSHQLNLQNYSIFARRKNNVVNVDDLRRIDGEGYRIIANLKNDADGKVWYIHPEPDISAEFWKTLDRPRGGYKTISEKTVTFKAKIGDSPESKIFEDESVAADKQGSK